MKITMSCLLCWAAVSLPAYAGTASIQVQDERGKPLPDAVVFLESREAKLLSRPIQGAEIAQINRQFVPADLVVPTGTAVTFPNRDTVRHHVYSFSNTKKFELKLFAGTPANPVVFDRPGIAVLGCNIHDNMAAWVVVVDTPFYARSDALGFASLVDVPAGNYRLRVWHSHLAVGTPATEQALTVLAANTSVSVRLTGLTP